MPSTSLADEDLLRAAFAGINSGYETHRPLLCEAVLHTRGSILELGTGEGSTPALHAVAMTLGRRVFSFDTDGAWIARYASLSSKNHCLARLPSWDVCPIESAMWSVALVDHAPAGRRITEISRLTYRAEILVVHDTEDPEYGYDSVFGNFVHRLDDRRYKQWTTLLSNYVDFAAWQLSGFEYSTGGRHE